jgi:hypothetical protein
LNIGFTKHGYNGLYWAARILPALIFLFILLPSCKITQELHNDELLVNKVRVEGIKDKSLAEGSKLLIKQKPNKRVFGFWRLYLRAYNYGMRGDTSKKIRRYMRNNVGEPPVVLDSAKLNETAGQIKAYLFNNGYFDAEVNYNVVPRGRSKKKALIKFKVTQKQPYTIKNIEYGIDDRNLYFLIMADTAGAKFKQGNVFSSEKMNEERERITQNLRNQGYYFFNKEYISFVVDSNLAGNFVNISMQIRNPGYYETHAKYTVSEIYITVINPAAPDSIEQQWRSVDSIWVNTNGYRMNDEVFMRNFIVRPGQLFRQVDVDNSYNKLNGIQLFKQTTINFAADTVGGKLICYVNLFPGKRQELIAEPQVISSDQNNAVEQNNLRNYGVANIFTYRNKNMFRNAETFEMRYRISLEGQFRKNDSIPFFSNIEHNLTNTLSLPRVLLLKGLQKYPDVRNPKASLVASFIYESNIDFVRRVISLGYNEVFSYKLHSFNISPVEVSYNRTNSKRDFLSLVNKSDSIFIANLFTTNLIVNSRITWVYTDKPLSRTGSFFYSRILIESAGFTLKKLMQATKQPLPADGIYKIDNVNFEQFVKLDADVRYTGVLNEVSAIASRFHLGLGRAYGNSAIMPFVRRYFIGGANSLRGWRPRTLGPGSFNNNLPGVRADRSGEMIIEAQTEYRFNIVGKTMQGAVFADAGNIWYTRPLAGRQGVEFKFSTFLDEVAVSSGFGIRFDFSFFVMRFDFGVPLRNPDRPLNDRWLINNYANGTKKFFPAVILNLGLGYPF